MHFDFRRVVVTGLGAVTNVGTDVQKTWRSLIEGRSGIGPITAFEQNDEWSVRIAGELRDWNPVDRIDHRESKRMDRFAQVGLYAAIEAAEDCGIDFSTGDPYRRGVVIGSGIGPRRFSVYASFFFPSPNFGTCFEFA